ncbi:cysteine-rich motor neuron 1 protein-like isoform X2 [Danio rerio]|uniref:Cysteine-rich motor neuron 1 protein-like isoform X2 n=1 Tax=Danio rerio TaxID=7955 RepID=A0AC58HPY8_DANRE
MKCHQSLLCVFCVLCFCLCARALAARECAPCALRSCPPVSPLGCGSGRVLLWDPCGCCEQCSRLELELCGGPDWTLGSCGSGLSCTALNRSGAARAPETGVCRVDDAADLLEVNMEMCPVVSGCERVDGQCVCDSRRSCTHTYRYPDRDTCVRAWRTGSRRHDHRQRDRIVGPAASPACVFSGCNLTADGCVCSSQSCDDHFSFSNRSQCQRAAVSPRCVHNGQQFSEGELYRMDPCWLCQCRGGVSFCSKAECAELDCQNSYIPEGECCPVCIDVQLLSVESSKASCWFSERLRAHEDQWKEDDCTFCQCVDGETHCTAMACKQSCHNPVHIPGECCPFCEEPSYETVSPLLCPPLQNCSLSEHHCPYGFQQDPSGCLLCQCVNNETCPDVSMYCSLDCPMGFEKDSYGCDVCECSVSIPKCRPMTCSKTCPYGFVRNKHGCEMCRCVRCPPFSCEKTCSGGFKKSRKGCSVCECKDSEVLVSSTSSSITSVSSSSSSSSGCVLSGGRRLQDGEVWHDGCRDCFCHAGREMCVLISCPVPTCANPVLRENHCCPTCDEESGSGQLEPEDLLVCRSPAGQLYVEGESWSLDACSRCTCRRGRVLCDSEICPPLLCHTPVRSTDSCCYTCPEDGLELPVDGGQQDFCVSSSGEVLRAGDSWKENPCTSCTCRNASVQCFSQRCPSVHCRVPVLRKGQCCPQCLDVSSTTAPVFVSSAEAEQQTTESSWTTPTLSATDLAQAVPGQMETWFIYQSAAWILSGILLALLVFMIAVILLNRRKSCVQMSCYGAPKKTVILKKHVNMNSVVYMEPSRENSFQSESERFSIPRAKLANTNVQR